MGAAARGVTAFIDTHQHYWRYDPVRDAWITPAMAVLQQAGGLPPLELAAHDQIQAQRDAGRLIRPAPLFEHARFQKFMREVFETVAYRKTTAAAAAKRLVDEGNALLNRIK